MPEEDDWRLQGQEDYLHGVTLTWKEYKARSETWEHEHCEFCWRKFMEVDDPEIHRWGYTTEDDYFWICADCYTDFKDMFEWQLTNTDA